MKILSKEDFEACLKGDPIAQRKFYEKAYPIAYKITKELSKTDTEAEDWAIKSVTNLFNKLSHFSGYKEVNDSYHQGRLYSWIRKATYNRCTGTYLKEKNSKDKEKEISVESMFGVISDDNTDDHLHMEELLTIVKRELVGEKQLKVFNMYIEGYSNKDIAEELGLAIGTVKWSISESRSKLREVLNKSGYYRTYHRGKGITNSYRAVRKENKTTKD